MSNKHKIFDTCHLCKKKSELTFEHIPPKVAFNDQTRYRTFPMIEYLQSSTDKIFTASGRVLQGGVGEYSLCKKCNSMLGNLYVPTYYRMALIARKILIEGKGNMVKLTTKEISPKKLLKQVLSMFISINPPGFTDVNPEILKFILDVNETFLPAKFKFYMYINCDGDIRHIPLVFHSPYGFMSEIAFPPLGFVMIIDGNIPPKYLTDITQFKSFDDDLELPLSIILAILETPTPLPGIYKLA